MINNLLPNQLKQKAFKLKAKISIKNIKRNIN